LRVRLLATLLGFGLLALAAGSTGGANCGVAKPLRVGIVMGLPTNGPDPWVRPALDGLERAVRNLGIEPKVLRPSLKEGYLGSFRYLGRQGYDLALGVGAFEAKAGYQAAGAFPATRFAIVDVSFAGVSPMPRNLEGVTFAAQEAGYLAGYLAALVEARRPGRDVVSSVGGWKAPPVDRFIAGYEAGARKARPGIVTLRAYARAFDEVNKAKCRNIALDQIAKGSGVVFQVAGACGLGALEAAKDKGVWGIGVDADQSGLGPHILTSALKRVDVAVYQTIRAVTEGRFSGGRTVELGLREGAVGLGTISPRVPRSLVAQVDRVRRQIVSGTIRQIPTVVR
jgi:basic membrane protein A